MIGPFKFHYLKESFMPLVYKYQVSANLVEGFNNPDEENDGLLTFFLNFDAPGNAFGIETSEVIRHYWELINYVDDKDLNLMSLDRETGEIKSSDKRYFVFEWCGEIETQTTLTINAETFIDYINLLLSENPDDPVFNIENLRNTRIINQFIKSR